MSVGFSEIATAAQLAALGCLVVALWVYGTGPARRRLLPLSVAGLLGGVLALAIVVAAPGNRLRAAFFPPPPELPALLALAVKLTAGYLQSAWITHPGNLLAAVVIPGALAAWLLADKFGFASVAARVGPPGIMDSHRRDRARTGGLCRGGLWPVRIAAGPRADRAPVSAGHGPGRVGFRGWRPAASGGPRASFWDRRTYFWKLVVAGMLVLFGWRGLQLTQETLATAAVFGPYAHAWDETYRLILVGALARPGARIGAAPGQRFPTGRGGTRSQQPDQSCVSAAMPAWWWSPTRPAPRPRPKNGSTAFGWTAKLGM